MIKLTFNKRDFLNAITIGGSCTGNGKILPIMTCIKMKVKNDTCRMVSYDGRNAINSECLIKYADEDISFCFEKEDIEKCVSLLKDDTFNISVSLPDKTMNIQQDEVLVQFPIQSADEYPILAQDADGVEFQMPSSLLKYWIIAGRPFLANDDMCLNLANIHFFIKDRKIEVFSSSNQHLYYDSSDIDTDIEHQFSMNLMSLNAVTRAFKNDEDVTIKSGTYNTLIKGSNATVLARKDDFKVRNYHMFLKYNPSSSVTIDKKQFKYILMMADTVHGLITISFRGNGISFSSKSLEYKKLYNDYIHVPYEGTEFDIVFNNIKLIQSINAISSDEVTLCPTGYKTPLIIKNADDNMERTYVMPFVN